MARRPESLLGAMMMTVAALALAISFDGACTRPQPCQDPTREGMCFCPLGQSCHHDCGGGTGNCTLGCSQGNPSCSVTCSADCTALCAGAGRCDAVCGPNCNVSCEWTKELCTAVVGPHSRVNCEGAANCQVSCNGSCEVACAQGHCRLRCAPGEQCDMECGEGASDRALVCPDGSRVCGQSC